jgi:DNA polymerase-3 subunit gamma/tau
VSVDPSRVNDGDIAETEGERLQQLAGRFSREDLMRAFDLLSNAEVEIRTVAQPRYHFEMVLLRWMHLRKLVPLSDLLEQMGSGTPPARSSKEVTKRVLPGVPPNVEAGSPPKAPIVPKAPAAPPPTAPAATFKDALLAEIRAGKAFFYNTVVAQAQKIDVSPDRVTFSFLPTHRALREQFEQSRGWLEQTAERVAGRKVSVVAIQTEGGAATSATTATTEPPAKAAGDQGAKRDLRAEAMSSSAVQAMLDVFPAEIRDVEEM